MPLPAVVHSLNTFPFLAQIANASSVTLEADAEVRIAF
jgi:hypothetical protein